MRNSRILLLSVVAPLSVFCAADAAFAFCGVIRASASGYSQGEALNNANNKGLVEVRRLESNYGHIQYSPAVPNCVSGQRVTCVITQRFCTSGGGGGGGYRPSRGEEGGGVHGCPRGTRPIPETDNCAPIRQRNPEFEHEPWKKPGCHGWKRRCDSGDNWACGKYESTCQVN